MSCNSTTTDHDFEAQSQKINNFLQNVDHKIVVMSGKGGVGKSTIATNLAVFLSSQGYKVGLLDVDVHGPSVAGLLGLTDLKLNIINNRIQPYSYTDNLKVISIQGLLNHPDEPLIWRGPMKIGIIRQFLGDADWGSLDFLIIDSPPGTGDEPLTVAQTVIDCQAVIVTTPQEISLADVRKSIQFCQKVNMPILGLIENMSGFVCPSCNSLHAIFKSGGGEKLATAVNIPFLGRLPIDPSVVTAGDAGQSIDSLNNPSKEKLQGIVEQIINQLPNKKKGADSTMKIAIPLAGGKLATHFGHCQEFAIMTIDNGNVIKHETLTPPPHAPGVIPNWVADLGCTDILVGGMGEAAQVILKERGVKVSCGAPSDTPENLVALYLRGELVDSGNACDHDAHGHDCGSH
ncbi:MULTISPECIES: iron-sulfur cluster carrier protein MrpORP [Pelosinus]|jgi:Mrp family chromosome partitioning ATPase/predicted Fe-Mo cluster-binding NifX family protein|uniref:Iron-sulfur cluster carrier protein n=1 Tax=Pelosinus fermentans B4 TaxID=1149862 RepID=I9L850_9FIRM|nr:MULTISPECIES: iron-sulfur cluster carrier protein MrpORP [Pelosinus]MDF2569390.1 ATPase-like, ParA/MinD [Sporomusa sp.]EIW16436.1 ATPase-like, ParA/MinD [Pelosinus fermentans B4]EIW22583.1 ATPase-like, ParA/MinD [Pelosinus fermentans A11]OAM95743.1 ATPase-like, ParA/MinD [Pelosinus fermentans DSM 17108]SDR32282.1 Chromosome partitioning ATPase, Mrp family, contains Fe-S cluster [Pelosinus fermentans]